MSETDLSFGEKLIKARGDAGYSQADFAEKMQIDRKTLAKWEKNLTFPNIEQIARIADFTDLPIEHFIDGYLNDGEEAFGEKMIKKLQQQTNRNTEAIEQLRGSVRRFSDKITDIVFAALYIGLLVLSGFRGEAPGWPSAISLGLIPGIALFVILIRRFREKPSIYTLILFLPAAYFMFWNIYWTIRTIKARFFFM